MRKETVPRVFACLFIFSLGIVDWIWATRSGLTFVDWFYVIVPIVFLAAIGLFYELSGRSARLGDAGIYTALWLAFALAGSIFTYVAITMDRPLYDAQLVRIDALMGFNWLSWYQFLELHRALRFILLAAYNSMLLQIVGSVLYFAHTRREDRNAELLLGAMIGILPTGLICGAFPAVSASVHFLNQKPDYLPDLLAAYHHTNARFDLRNMQGIVTMPSYHAVLGVLFVYVHRPPCRTFVYVAALNLLMLAAIAPYGGHYFADVVAGVVIAAISIPIAHALANISVGGRSLLYDQPARKFN